MFVVEFPRDPGTLLFMRLNQPASHTAQSFLRELVEELLFLLVTVLVCLVGEG